MLDEELVEVDFEHVENDIHLTAILFIGFAMFGFVVFVAFTRGGGISRANVIKAWKDIALAIKGGFGKVKREDDDDDFSVEEYSIEMREGGPAETLIV
jgi:hypothetical protein